MPDQIKTRAAKAARLQDVQQRYNFSEKYARVHAAVFSDATESGGSEMSSQPQSHTSSSGSDSEAGDNLDRPTGHCHKTYPSPALTMDQGENPPPIALSVRRPTPQPQRRPPDVLW